MTDTLRVALEALLPILAKATPGPFTVTYETNVTAGDGYSATSVQSNLMDTGERNAANAAALVAAVNFLRDHGDALLARLAPPAPASSLAPLGEAWQPIETAPKDRAILVIGGTWHDDTSHTGNEYPLHDWALASWRNGWWIGYGEAANAECWAEPTHWAPLPPMQSDVSEKEKKLRPGSRAWREAAAELALSYAPSVGACKKCKQPCLAGYCCQFCGAGDGCTDPETGEDLRR